MKKVLSILCTFFLLHSSCAIPLESEVSTRGIIDSFIDFIWGESSPISSAALKIFSTFILNIGTLVNTTVTGINTLTNDKTQTASQTTQTTIAAFKQALAIPVGIGSKIQGALQNYDANSGLFEISKQFNSLVNNLGSAINMTTPVNPVATAAIQNDLSNLTALANAIVSNVTAAAKAAKSGLNFIFPKPLVKVLGDPTLSAMQQAIQVGVVLMNNATSAFVAAVQSNPFITFVNDVLIVTTKDALTAASAGIQNIVSQAINTATTTVQGTISTSLNGLNILVPSLASNVSKILSNFDWTISTAVGQVRYLSTGARVTVQTQVKASIGNLTQLVGYFQANLTQAIQDATSQILSNVQTSATNVTTLAQNVVQKVVTALTTSKLQAKATAIDTLTKLLPIAQNGLSNLMMCIKQAAAVLHDNTNAIVNAFNGTTALLVNNINACLNQTTETAALSCVNVSI